MSKGINMPNKNGTEEMIRVLSACAKTWLKDG
jgi:hypothetical protein